MNRTQNKFKVGERVEIIAHYYFYGVTDKIKQIDGNECYVKGRWFHYTELVLSKQ